MIFRPKLARAILRGEKTQTRRPVKWIDASAKLKLERTKTGNRQPLIHVPPDHPGPKVKAPCRYKPEHDYALQFGRGKAAEEGVRLHVSTVREERLGDISYEDARCEGFKNRDEFWAYWLELYGEEPDHDLLVWVVTFEPMYADRFMAFNLDPRKGPLDVTNTPPITGLGKEEGELVPAAYEEQLVDEAHQRDIERLVKLHDSLGSMAQLANVLDEPEINGELHRAGNQLTRARDKIKSKIDYLERAA